MEYQSKSSFTRGGNIITPEHLSIDDKYVRWRKNMGISRLFMASTNITVLRSKIVGIEVVNKIIGSDIIISTFGDITIRATCFTAEDAKQIRDILL